MTTDLFQTQEEQQLSDYIAKLKRRSYHSYFHDPTTIAAATPVEPPLKSFCEDTSTLMIKEALVKYDGTLNSAREGYKFLLDKIISDAQKEDEQTIESILGKYRS